MTKEMFINSHPNINFNNTNFLTDEAFKDFDDEQLVNLCKMSHTNAWLLYEYIYIYSYEQFYKEMLIKIAKINPKFFDISNINDVHGNPYDCKKFDYKVIFCEYEILFNNGLIKTNNVNYNNIYEIEFVDAFLQMKNEYKESGKLNDKVINTLTSFLKQKILKEDANIANVDSIINEIIGYLLSSDINLSDIIIYRYTTYKRILVEGKYKDKLVDFDTNSLDALLDIKVKQVKNLMSRLRNEYEEFDSYSYHKQFKFTINMLAILGYQNSEKLINLLDGNEKYFSDVFYSFFRLDLQKIHLDSNRIVYDENFIDFFFSPNGILKHIISSDYEIIYNLDVIYENYEEFEKRFKSQNIQNKMDFYKDIIRKGITRPLEPDLYLLEGDIINECVDNKKFQKYTKDKDIIQNVCDEYRKVRHNFMKTIPYVSGEKDGYYYETLLCDDPNLFVMGSKTNCCFKIGGEASSFVQYCAENINGRVLVIKNDKGKVCGMIPFVRNGNLLLCNSIESVSVKNLDTMRILFDVATSAFEKMINISSNNEIENESITVVLMGNYKNQINEIGNYDMVSPGLISFSDLRPLDEKDDMYANMGGYDYTNYIITQKDDYAIYTSSSFHPRAIYFDPRKETKIVEKEYITNDDIKEIEKIYYEKTNGKIDLSHALKLIYNKDYFILINDDYSIVSMIVGCDPRALEEYTEYLSLEKEYVSNFDKNGHIKESAYYR